ncbi:hypothetical protein RCC89_02015 [Cytophagaceae bacterium ABcell3]|nr:hypothetical protein RCC89_02015 [Cytophagaceae bacterium ABcell3]
MSDLLRGLIITTIVDNKNRLNGINCIKSMLDGYENSISNGGEVNIADLIVKDCLFAILKDELLSSLLEGPKSPYGKFLKGAFKNKTLNDIRGNITRVFNCSEGDVDRILSSIPSEILSQLIDRNLE